MTTEMNTNELDNRYTGKGVGGTGLGLGIAGTALGLLNGGWGLLNNGGQFGSKPAPGPAPYITREEFALANELAAKDACIADLNSEMKDEKKMVEVYTTLANKISEVNDKVAANRDSAEKESIVNTNKTILARTMSFTEEKSLASDFSDDYVITIQSSSKPLVNLEAICYGIRYVFIELGYFDLEQMIMQDIYEDPYDGQYHQIQQAFNDMFDDISYGETSFINIRAQSKTEFPSDYYELGNYGNEILETEWLVPENTTFIPIDRNKLIFKI